MSWDAMLGHEARSLLERRRSLSRLSKSQLLDIIQDLEAGAAGAVLGSAPAPASGMSLAGRALHRAIAHAFHYFWMPCDQCGAEFGGHERGWKSRNVAIPGDTLLCPRCAAIHEIGSQS